MSQQIKDPLEILGKLQEPSQEPESMGVVPPSRLHQRVSEGLLQAFRTMAPKVGGPIGMSMGMLQGFLATGINKMSEEKLKEEFGNLEMMIHSWLNEEE
ncbi:MAG: hypothetical protein ACRETA_04445 [Gammaproteobacteria bacterium]